MTTYTPKGVCPTQIQFEVTNDTIKNVKFTGGCAGNLQAIGILIEDMPVAEVIKKLKGNICRNGTSCTDQLAQALESLQK